jgi:hypothetical protein
MTAFFPSSLTLSLAEDGALSKPRPELKDLGMITVELYQVRAGKAEFCNINAHTGVNTGHENIPEKHLKGQAISTQVK